MNSKHFKKIVTGCSTICIAALFASAGNAALLEELSQTARNTIEKICLPIQFSKGTSAYRECVLEQIASHEIGKVSVYNGLTFDEKYAVQKTCEKLFSKNSNSHRQCVTDEIAGLAEEPAALISELTDDEQHIVRQACYRQQENDGVIAYRQCLNSAVAEISRIAEVDLTPLSSLDRNSILLTCNPANTSTSPSEYRRCLSSELLSYKESERPATLQKATFIEVGNAIGETGRKATTVKVFTQADILKAEQEVSISSSATSLTAVPVLGAATLVAQADTAAKQQRVISRPQIATGTSEQVETQQENVTGDQSASTHDNAAISNPGSDRPDQSNTAEGEKPLGSKPDFTGEFPDWVPDALREPLSKLNLAGLDKKLLSLAGLVAIPILLLVLLVPVIVRRRKSATNNAQDSFDSKLENRSKDFLDDDFEKENVDENPNKGTTAKQIEDVTESPIHLFENESANVSEQIDPDFGTNVESVVDNDIPLAAEPTNLDASDAQQPTIAHVSPTLQSTFGEWLTLQSADKQNRYCIEFLLYWISYADQKVDSETKEKLNATVDLDDHARIKKAVLNRNPQSLLDTLHVINAEFSSGQKEQTLNLLMAVLIKDRITPMQNIFIRFYSDFIGMGTSGLEEKFRAAYGCDIPPLPRPDRLQWWKLQTDASQAGAPVGHDFNFNNNPQNALLLARVRFNPGLFDQLGSKEQQLVKRHFLQTVDQLDSLQEIT